MGGVSMDEIEEVEVEEEEKLFLDNNSGISYRSSEKKLNDPILYAAETIECSAMLFFFIAVTLLILIFPGISSAILTAYSKIKKCGIKEILSDMVFQIKQLL